MLDATSKGRAEIPNVVVATASKALGEYYYSHTRLNTLFTESIGRHISVIGVE
jgi:hypothetical protein